MRQAYDYWQDQEVQERVVCVWISRHTDPHTNIHNHMHNSFKKKKTCVCFFSLLLLFFAWSIFEKFQKFEK